MWTGLQGLQRTGAFQAVCVSKDWKWVRCFRSPQCNGPLPIQSWLTVCLMGGKHHIMVDLGNVWVDLSPPKPDSRCSFGKVWEGESEVKSQGYKHLSDGIFHNYCTRDKNMVMISLHLYHPIGINPSLGACCKYKNWVHPSDQNESSSVSPWLVKNSNLQSEFECLLSLAWLHKTHRTPHGDSPTVVLCSHPYCLTEHKT